MSRTAAHRDMEFLRRVFVGTRMHGVPMLQRLCDAIFAADDAKPAPGDGAGTHVA